MIQRIAALLLSTLLVVASCAQSPTEPEGSAEPTPAATPTPAGPSEPEGKFTIALREWGTESWVPRLATAERVVLHLVLDTLIGLDAETRKLTPRLAESWSLEEVGSEWVWNFKLREGVQFNEGKGDLTAEDVKFSWGEFLKPDTLCICAGAISNAVDGDMANFEIVSPYEFELHSSKPTATLPLDISNSTEGLTILPKEYYESVGDEGWQKHPIGSGPFTWVEHQTGERLSLEAVPNHWRQTPQMKVLDILLVPEDSTRLAMLTTGEIDLAPFQANFKAELDASSDVKLFDLPNGNLVHVALGGMYYDLPDKNCTACPWVGYDEDARNVREALTLAIDRQAIIDRLLFGEGLIAAAPFAWFPGPFEFNDPGWSPPSYDPDKAKELLEAAGHPDGFDIELTMFTERGVEADIGELVASYWDAIGLSVKRTRTEFRPIFREKLGTRDTAGLAWVISTVGIRDDPISLIGGNHMPEGDRAYLHDATVTELVHRGVAEVDQEARNAIARELGTYYIEERLGIPMMSIGALWGASSAVESWPSVNGKPELNNVEYIRFSR